ncbi:hypothetical protein RQP53_02375 [Paucibacter sp. APW11]|uniref:Uncharacterized protein n=1 Tax=Roseateles aquae TaxID=3077235 RepID=A0ABU3P7C3_9BURK|nr:hypothetical protein [Paucibacter sp. APW11]MDT8998115.1 hypothetical protein [Paucibacter sp. APW11]
MISALISTVLRLVFALATVFFVLLLMSVALLSLLGFVLWSLIRGRRPVVDLSGFARARQFRAGAFRPSRPGASQATGSDDIVDVEVREVRAPSPQLK